MTAVLSRIPSYKWIQVARVEAWTKQGCRCRYCLSQMTRRQVTADHVKPKSEGGVDTKNIVAACRRCNWAKRSMSEKAFLKAIKSDEWVNFDIALCAAVRKINLRADRACKRVRRLIGPYAKTGAE